MDFNNHLKTNLVTFSAWLSFVLLGVVLGNHYFQDSSLSEMIAIHVLAVFIVVILTYMLLLKVWQKNYFKNAFWIALYASVPLAFYDLVYVGWFLGEGLDYHLDYWYLTLGYIWVWFVMPLVGLLMERLAFLSSSDVEVHTKSLG